MKASRLLPALLLLLAGLCTYAQNTDYIIEVTAGKKILKADNLDLPPATTVKELLNIFPEMLAREGDMTLGNYDVQVNDVSMGSCKENILMQYKLSDIQSIEVSANPSTSQQKNGQGGVIKVLLKDLDEGFSGNASIYFNTILRTQPGVTVGYRKNSWTVRSSLLMEYYRPHDETSIRETHNYAPKKITYTQDTSDIRQGYEMLTVDAVYQPDSRNKLHLWANERLLLKGVDHITDIEVNSNDKAQKSEELHREFKYLAGVNYKHNFSSSTFETEWTFEGTPYKYGKYIYDLRTPGKLRIWQYDLGQNQNIFQGLAKYVWHMIPDEPHRKADFTAGMNTSCTPQSSLIEFRHLPDNSGINPDIPQTEITDSHNSITYISPYIESENYFGNWFLKAGLRFQHYITHIKVVGMDDFDRPENYFTAFLNLGYQIAPHHHLSMILDRSIKRMDFFMMYPYRVFLPDYNWFSEGNPSLMPVSIHNLTLNYITDFKADDKKFTFDTELKYINSDRLLMSDKQEEAIFYRNDGHSNIFAANLLFLMESRIFWLTFAGNYFINRNKIGGTLDKYNYFNLTLIPSIHFDNGWKASIRFTYNSHIYTNTSRLSDYFYTVTNFSKSWKKITAYLELSDNFHSTAIDEIYGQSMMEIYQYNLHRPGLELGVYIKF